MPDAAMRNKKNTLSSTDGIDQYWEASPSAPSPEKQLALEHHKGARGQVFSVCSPQEEQASRASSYRELEANYSHRFA